MHEDLSSWNDLIKINWESLDMKAQGLLEIKEDFQKFRNKIFVSPLKIDLEIKGATMKENNFRIYEVLQYQPMQIITKFHSSHNLELTASIIIRKVHIFILFFEILPIFLKELSFERKR